MKRVPGDDKYLIGVDGKPIIQKPQGPPNEIFKGSEPGGWYLAGCFWCCFCLGVALGGSI